MYDTVHSTQCMHNIKKQILGTMNNIEYATATNKDIKWFQINVALGRGYKLDDLNTQNWVDYTAKY